VVVVVVVEEWVLGAGHLRKLEPKNSEYKWIE
jgi:hypothetical protein